MKGTLKATFTAAIIALAGATYADDSDPIMTYDYNDAGAETVTKDVRGFEMGFSGGMAQSKLKNVKSKKGFLGALNMGFQFNRYVAIELTGEIMPKVKQGTKTAKYYAVTANLKAILPFNDVWRMYLKAGAGKGFEDVSNGKMSNSISEGVYAGDAGLAIYFTPHTSMTLGAHYITTAEDDYHALGGLLGVNFVF